MNRKEFLKWVSMSSLMPFSAFAFEAEQGKKLRRITVLHTNDTHARIDPFPKNHPQYANLGGFARRASFVKQVRNENKHTLLLDAGDVFQGTPYFNMYKGKLDYKLMSDLKYDATTLGNHEFDNGVDGLVDSMSALNFPVLVSNLWIQRDDLKEKVLNYMIKEVNGVRIGLFGITLDFPGLVIESNHVGVSYRDPISVAQGISRNLKNYLKCDYVICLSHLGYEYPDSRPSDLVLANAQNDIDMIIGGHTHTFLPEPTVIKKSNGKSVIVNQVGFAGINVGRLDLFFNEKNEFISHISNTNLINQSWT